jgi:hypothetical protein
MQTQNTDNMPEQIRVSIIGKILSVFGHKHTFDKIVGCGAGDKRTGEWEKFTIHRCWCGTMYYEIDK